MVLRTYDSERIKATPFQPRLFGLNGAITSEHYLAAEAGADVLKSKGNAVDAAIAAALVEGVLNPHQHTIGGECPILIQTTNMKRPVVINGNTMAPLDATVENYRKHGFAEVPDVGILAAGVPAAIGAYTIALERYGTMSFAEVVSPALAFARNGFPVHRGLLHMPDFGVETNQDLFCKQWKNTAEIYLPGDQIPEPGQLIKNPALADCLQTLIEVEHRTAGDRGQCVAAVNQEFYSGDIASEIENHSKARDGFLARSDLEAFKTYVEDPQSIYYMDCEVFKCGPWNQGPALLQTLSILKNFELRKFKHNSAEYLHLVIEAVKLAFADREQWYGDPSHVNVPIDVLLSDEYGNMRAGLIDDQFANSEICPGDPVRKNATLPLLERLGGKSWGSGTVHVDAIDRNGCMVAATPSGGWLKSSEIVQTIGVPLGNRLMTFYLSPQNHPNLIAPRKRPRTTISPTLVHRNDKPWMVYGSMGGDQQDQWMLQFLLNRVVFDMTIAESIEAPKFSSQHFPGFFSPHEFFQNRVRIESDVNKDVIDALCRRGHDVEVVPQWTEGFLLAIERNHTTGVLEAGCDLRGAKADVFPSAARCW